MKFTYNEQWRDELLKHAFNKDITREEAHKFGNLVLMADDTDDEEVISTLFDALQVGNLELGGIEETIFGTLSSTDYKAYYTALFRDIPKILNGKDRDLAVYLVHMTNGDTLTTEQWKTIKDLANQYLNKDILKELVELMEKNNYFSLEEVDYPYPEFYAFFQKLLKEKSEQ